MASRRKLKKTIEYVSTELMTTVYFRCLMSKEVDEQKINEVTVAINQLNQEFILRANHSDGKNNPQVVKTYFRKLFADWQLAVEKIIKDIEAL